jgi:hypothetical protein
VEKIIKLCNIGAAFTALVCVFWHKFGDAP